MILLSISSLKRLLLVSVAFFACCRCEGAEPFVAVLGVAQDGGYPQVGCRKACCKNAWKDPALRRHVASLAIVDPQSQQRWLLDCTPDFREQLHLLDQISPIDRSPGIDGIFLTHAHMGHYTGLMHLGREVLGARGVPVYAMSRMRTFLETNGPWDQLVSLGQIELKKLSAGQEILLNGRIKVVAFPVPHRDEYSETVGFRISGPSKTVIYLPDIDKWERWSVKIEDCLSQCDHAFLAATFFDVNELPGRDMSEIPHPFVVETIRRLSGLPLRERQKVKFIHLNHSNPLLNPTSAATGDVERAGHAIAIQGERIEI